MKQAPYLWYQALAKALGALGFLCLHADHCCFTNADRDVFVLVFVDDIQITGPNIIAIETLRDGLKATFSLRELEAQTFLGLQIERDLTKRRLRLHQKPYAQKVLQDYGFRDFKPVATPMLEQNLIPHYRMDMKFRLGECVRIGRECKQNGCDCWRKSTFEDHYCRVLESTIAASQLLRKAGDGTTASYGLGIEV